MYFSCDNNVIVWNSPSWEMSKFFASWTNVWKQLTDSSNQVECLTELHESLSTVVGSPVSWAISHNVLELYFSPRLGLEVPKKDNHVFIGNLRENVLQLFPKLICSFWVFLVRLINWRMYIHDSVDLIHASEKNRQDSSIWGGKVHDSI